MGPVLLSFDVTGGLPDEVTGGQQTRIAAWLFLPDDLTLLGAKPVTMVLLNGGSYDKRYYHVEIPGHPGYSAAEYLAGLGNIVLVPDHLGVSDSSRVPDQKKATRFVVAQAMDCAVRQFYRQLSEGTLHDSLPALADFHRIGGGHSMGAMMTIIQQANHRTYEAAMILGYTADGVHMTSNGTTFRAADMLPPGGLEIAGDYTSGPREGMHESIHWEDVPSEVIAADDANAVETPSQIGFVSVWTGIIREEAAQLDVPLYICLGERDVSPNPHAEPTFYSACTDMMLHILPRSGHCQNFAGTRHQMWDRMHGWSRCITGS